MPTVVIGEDTADLAGALSRIFTRAGFDVRVEFDGPSTLATVRTSLPDLLVLDLLMPGLSSLEVCKAMRDDPATAAVPVLMMSAAALPADLKAGRAAGADDYLSKPFASMDLVAHARALLKPPASSP